MTNPAARSVLSIAASAVIALIVSGPAKAGDPATTTFSFGAGATQFSLPDVSFVSVQDSNTSSTVARELNHDGALGGASYDASLEQLLGVVGKREITGQLEGFFAQGSGTQATDCVRADPFYCYVPALVDDPLSGDGLFTTTDGETFGTVAARSVEAWGVAAGAVIGGASPMPGADVQFGGGFDFRHFTQSMSLDTTFVPDPAIYSNYRETLAIDYAGAYLATHGSLNLWQGASLSATGRIGIYDASTQYAGAELQVFPSTPDDNYSLALSRQNVAFIASVRSELKQKMGPVTLALFDTFDWYSWAPAMKYNDNDQGYPGMQVGTEIGDGQMCSNTAGVRALVNF